MPKRATLKNDLIAARALISDIKGWTQFSHARDVEGVETMPWSSRAVCFCADGAMAKACRLRSWEHRTVRYDQANVALTNAALGIFGADPVSVNDGDFPDHTNGIPDDYDLADNPLYDERERRACWKHILEVFDKAIDTAPA